MILGNLRITILLSLTLFGAGQRSSIAQESEDPPARVARLTALNGQVSLEPAGVNQWNDASPNYPIAAGDRLYVNESGQAELQIGEIVTRLWRNSDLTVTNLTDELAQLGLSQGVLRLRTFGLQANEDVEVDTPNGAVTVIRPGDIRVEVYPGNGGTVVTVNSGQVQISGGGVSEFLNQGQSLRLVGNNPVVATRVGISGFDAFDHWSQERDRLLLNSSSAQYVGQDVPGYEDLDQYGEWMPASDYGPVWFPRSVPAGWAPYRYGHWIWTSRWGWTWVEEEPWGYAPFHYGRWVSLHGRWGWLPGPVMRRPVWSPALVVFASGSGVAVQFRTGGSPGVSAWFPLGPGEPYRPWYRCSPRYVERVNVTNIRVSKVVVVQKTYITNNYNEYNFHYRSAAMTAVPSDAFATGRPVRQNIVPLDANRLKQMQLVEKPEVRPTVTSMAPRPTPNVPLSPVHPALLPANARPLPVAPAAHPQPVQALPGREVHPTNSVPVVSSGSRSNPQPTAETVPSRPREGQVSAPARVQPSEKPQERPFPLADPPRNTPSTVMPVRPAPGYRPAVPAVATEAERPSATEKPRAQLPHAERPASMAPSRPQQAAKPAGAPSDSRTQQMRQSAPQVHPPERPQPHPSPRQEERKEDNQPRKDH